MSEVVKVESCRACSSKNLKPIISLGNQYVTNFINSEDEQKDRAPLDLILCNDCKVLQLQHNAPAESMWNEQYWYKSAISTTIKNDLADIAKNAQQKSNLSDEDIVVDIGCNDGTLLSFYNKEKQTLVGFEPSKNVSREAAGKGFNVINDFFNADAFKKEFGDKKAKIITAISMFYDLENPNAFLEDIKKVLDEKGLFVIQQNYLVTMLQYNAFDNICHEHREYYSLTSLMNLLKKHGLEVFDVEENDINGGSIRTYIRMNDNPSAPNERVSKVLEKEKMLGLDTMKPYLDFAARISSIKERSMEFLRNEKKKGKRIWIYGASTRGNVILQYFGLGPDLVDGIADKNSDKWGKKTIGSLIPITSPEEMRKVQPDYLVVNTWHFLDEIVRQEDEYRKKGGQFVAFLPEFKIVK